MATVPAKARPDAPSLETVEQRFRRLEAVWEAETAYLSSHTEIVAHPAFQEIVRLGNEVVPFLLRDLERRPSLLVWALPRITGANPVPTSDSGKLAKMSEAWVRWGTKSQRC